MFQVGKVGNQVPSRLTPPCRAQSKHDPLHREQNTENKSSIDQ